MFDDPEIDLSSTESVEGLTEKILDWKEICFLPFKMLWKTAIVLVVFLEIIFVSYSLMFETKEDPSYLWSAYYLFEVFYAIDTSLFMMHKFLLNQQKKKTHVPKTYITIIIDLITLMPYYEIYYLLGRVSKGKNYDFIRDRFKWKVILRIYRIPSFFDAISKTPGLNHIASDSIGHMVYFLLYCALGGCFWYYITTISPEMNWSTTYLKYHNFNNYSSYSWYILSCSLVGNLFAHNWSGLILASWTLEYYFFMVTMLLGFLNHYMILFGKLIALFMKKVDAQFRFSMKLYVIQNMMHDWNVPQKTQKEVIEIYNAVWEQRSGILDRPKMTELLPESLRKEINLDIFWVALKHSPIFDQLDIAAKRHLVLSMKSTFLKPGDYILKAGDVKSKMIYVVSGVVQILSQENQSSPILSFSSGTILGETTIFQPTTSTVSLNCASYCEIHSLDYCSFWKIIQRYSKTTSIPLRTTFNERIATARQLQNPSWLKIKSKDKKYTDIRWIKSQWQTISHQTKGIKKRFDEKHETVLIYHTSKHLSLYVLSEDVELKVKTICLRSTFPYIFEPTSSFLKTFEYLVLGAIIGQCLLLPYMLFFNKVISIEVYAIFYALDALYGLGLILEVSTAIKKSDRIISTLGQILVYKGKHFSFLIDITATLPWELLDVSSDSSLYTLLRVNRLLKIYKVFIIINKSELNVWVHYIQIRTLKYLVIILCSVYFLSAFSYGLITIPVQNENGWLFYNQNLIKKLKNRVSELSHFWLSFEYVLTIILSQSWRAYFAYSIPDILLELIIVMAGYFLYIFCFSEVGACAALSHQAEADYQFYLTTLTNFANLKRVSHDLRQLMYEMVQCQWEYNGRFEISGPRSILRQLPEYLRNQILIARIVRSLRLIPMFLECDENVLLRVAYKASVNIFPPNCVLVQEECFSSNLHVILRGFCLAESYIPTDKYHEVKTELSMGDSFPLLEMLMSIDSFLRVTSQSYVEIATISLNDLMNALDRESDFYADVLKVVNEHFDEYKIIWSRQKGRLPEMISTGKLVEAKGDFFRYEISDQLEKIREKTYNLMVWNVLGTGKFLRHFVFKRTINPKKKIYVTWECFRCLISIIQVIYCLFFTKTVSNNTYIGYVFFLIAIIDFYIRSHCQYYNKKGVLVTHPLYTVKHYFSTSFLLDLFCSLPYALLGLDKFFGKHQNYGLLLLMILTRPLLIYRLISGVTYLQNQSTGKAVLYHNIKYIMVVILSLGVATAVLEGITCPETSFDGTTSCPEDSWIYRDVFKGKQSFSTTTMICCYVVISIFTSSTVGLFVFERRIHIVWIAFLSFAFLAIRWFMLAKITSSRIGGNTRLVHYQHNMNEFLRFSKKYYLNQELVDETVSYYEYVWKRTKGSSINRILPSFHPVLRAKICADFYEPTMKHNQILHNLELSAVKHITPHFIERHFKKDADIIRCNDVTDTIYIVHKGSVEIKIANDRLAVLTRGGMFGNFNPKGKTRLTITAKAKIHCELLVLDVITFYKVISRYKTAINRLNKNRLINSEFILPTSEHQQPKSDQKISTSKVCQEAIQKTERKKPLWLTLLTFTVYSDNKWVSLFNYILNVHLSMISSLTIMTFIVKVGKYDIMNYYYIGYVFDVIFLSKLILKVHTTFIDQDSGLVITQYTQILTKNLSNPMFWYELFTIIPFELVYYIVENEDVYRYCWSNRILKFIYLKKYYNNCKNTLTVSRLLRWTYLVYSMMALIHTNVCIWWKVSCPQEICYYYPKVNHEPIKLTPTNDTAKAFRLSYMYVINVFTSTGLRMITPTNAIELIVSIIMTGFSQLVTVVITAGCASILVLDKFEMTMFENGSRKVLKYLAKMNMSYSLKRKVWRYYCEQWTKAHGQWLPLLIEIAPSYLKEDVMHSLYSRHLLEHQIFDKTHKDFIRQLMVHLTFSVYLPGMYIVEKGDVDDSLYFIEEGEVVVYDIHNKIHVENKVLMPRDTFGESQVLFGLPHLFTYKALSTTIVLVLRKGTWEYLMEWFPASKEQILQVSNQKYKPQS